MILPANTPHEGFLDRVYAPQETLDLLMPAILLRNYPTIRGPRMVTFIDGQHVAVYSSLGWLIGDKRCTAGLTTGELTTFNLSLCRHNPNLAKEIAHHHPLLCMVPPIDGHSPFYSLIGVVDRSDNSVIKKHGNGRYFDMKLERLEALHKSWIRALEFFNLKLNAAPIIAAAQAEIAKCK